MTGALTSATGSRWLTMGLVLLFGKQALAHGRPAAVRQIAVRARSDDGPPVTLVAATSWGMVRSDDGGQSFRWVCGAAMGLDPTRDDPAIALAGATLVLGFAGGLRRGSADGCDYAAPDAALSGEWVVDVAVDPARPARVYALRSPSAGADVLYRSEDGGRTWAARSGPIESVRIERIAVAPSDPNRLYLSGADLNAEPRRAYLLASSDAGATFVRSEVDLEAGERNLLLLAVDPTDPDRLFARVSRSSADTRDERIVLSEDGGHLWRSVLTGRALHALGISEDGRTVLAGSRQGGGLFRSSDGGHTFTPFVTPLSVLCITPAGDDMLICADELRDGFSIGRVSPGAPRVEALFRFSEPVDLLPCGRCTAVGAICPAWRDDVAYDLGWPGARMPTEVPTLHAPLTLASPAESARSAACRDPAGCALHPRPPRHRSVADGPGPRDVPALFSLSLLFAAAQARSRRRGRMKNNPNSTKRARGTRG